MIKACIVIASNHDVLIKGLNLKFKIILIELTITLLANFAHASIGSCKQLFNDSNLGMLVERRKEQVWTVTESAQNVQKIIQFDFMPPVQRLKLGFALNGSKELFLETIVKVENTLKLKTEKIPLDLMCDGLVIDGGLESGRKFVESILSEGVKQKHTKGVFIFIDINNLGFINKNFFEKNKTGDHYVKLVSKMLNRLIGDKGLLVRMGGDEFAILMPAMSPEDVKSLQNKIMRELKNEVHEVFKFETLSRVENVKILQKAQSLGFVSQTEYNSGIEQFKKYVTYSQEGLSVGAAYFGAHSANSASDVQTSAENLATQMKLEIKMALHQDVSKYTGRKYQYSGSPRLAFRYDFPLLNEVDYKPQKYQSPPNKNFNLPPLLKTRGAVIKRFGQISLVRYLSEDGQSETRIEYYDSSSPQTHSEINGLKPPQRLVRSGKVDIHSHSSFPDFKSSESQDMMKYFLSDYTVDRGVIWINLQNLGKLNYFKHKTLTGDRMIKRFSEIIAESLRDSDIPIKLPGSEFLILIDQVGPEKLKKMSELILKKIDSDEVVHQIYQEQIDDLNDQILRASSVEEQKMLLNQIEEIQNMKSKPKLLLKHLYLKNQKTGYEQVIRYFQGAI